MDPQELRMGNYIQLYRKPEDPEMSVHKIKSIFYSSEYKCPCVELEDGFIINAHRGIAAVPLTKEWIVKLGFEYTYSFDFEINMLRKGPYIANPQFIKGDLIGYMLLWLTLDWRAIHGPVLKYVHQFQNIYRASSGVEL